MRCRRAGVRVEAWGRPAVATSPAAAAAALAAKEAILKVPLWQHSLKCLVIIAASCAAAHFISKKLHQEADKVDAGEELSWLTSLDEDKCHHKDTRPFLAVATESTLIALHRPAAIFIPVAAAIHSLRSVAVLLNAVLVHQAQSKNLAGWLVATVQNCVRTLGAMDSIVIEVSEVALIVFVMWTLLRLKERIVKILVERGHRQTSGGAPGQEQALERVILPLSGLVSWLVVLVGCLMALHVLGINIQPLLTVGGVSGIIVGLSAQSVMSNMISGINIFLSRPFVVGDRIELTTGTGAKMLTGFVERVDPMRTIIRTDTCLPIMIPNKVLSEMIISNESRIMKSRVVTNFNKARQYGFTLSLRYQDFDRVEGVVKALRAHLDTTEGLDKRLPLFVGFSSMDNFACNIAVLVHTTPPTSREFGSFRQRLLLAIGRIVRKEGARLAYPTQINLVPGLDDLTKSNGSGPAGTPSNGAANGAAAELQHNETGAGLAGDYLLENEEW
ncbi:hypothetical protein WJX72_003191 [[Myrmecia] bisecta]|uniref:Mechanosensitive ion channel MscS domain-containing protein n=1 Tax=[Myrmecia] bisecta TaxID=41462 RepID=A0AAW1PG66_9CHLO